MFMSLKFSYIPYNTNKITFFYLFTKTNIVNKQEVLF